VRDLVGECREGTGHIVDGVGEGGDLTLRLHSEALIEITIGHRGHHLHDPADLFGHVGGHEIDVVGEVVPVDGDAGRHCLATELALGAHLSRYAGHLGGETVELIDHCVDGVLQLQDLTVHIYSDLFGQVTARYRRRDVGDVADLAGQVRRHEIDAV